MTPVPEGPRVSVVVPTLDAGEDLVAVVQQTIATLEGRRPFEVVIVDDGGGAPGWERIRRMAREHDAVRGVRLERTSGQIPAFFAGVAVSEGEVVVSMDDDLEVLPEDIPLLLELIDSGHDMVGGHRTSREQRPLTVRTALARSYWWMARRLLAISFRDAGCGLKAFRRPVLLEVMARGPDSMRGLRPVWELSRAATHPADVPIRWQPSSRPSNYRTADLARLAIDLLRHVLVTRTARRGGAGPDAAPLYVIRETVGGTAP